jgi:hypothetical protein
LAFNEILNHGCGLPAFGEETSLDLKPVQYSPGAIKKDGRILVFAAAIITGLQLARDPRAGARLSGWSTPSRMASGWPTRFMRRLCCDSVRGILISSGELHR